MHEQELRHYGVPGMKWGVRKAKRAVNRKIKTLEKTAREQDRHSKKNDEKYKETGKKAYASFSKIGKQFHDDYMRAASDLRVADVSRFKSRDDIETFVIRKLLEYDRERGFY